MKWEKNMGKGHTQTEDYSEILGEQRVFTLPHVAT
jgi:hypothetical protein